MKQYLARTIESTLRNLAPGDEYFIIDGGSTDGSVDVIRSYESRLTGWVSERDRGYAHALSKGFARARGDILCWINASDLLLGGALEAARAQLARTQAEMIFGDDFYIDEQDRVVSYSRGHVADLRASMLYGGWTPLQDACFWTRRLYESVGGIDDNLGFAADYDLFLRMSGAGRVAYVPTAFSAFRRHEGQKSIAGSRRYREEREFCRKREVAKEQLPAWRRVAAEAVHAFGVRWRVHVRTRFYRRPDLQGVDVGTLPAKQYGPRHEEVSG
jgi:glycosyltransferase involved in cell wall biosynthesis